MAKVIKITKVKLLTAMNDSEAKAASRDCIKLLREHEIRFDHLHYDEAQIPVVLEGLSVWTYGPQFIQYDFKKLPLVIWKEFYDDYERWIEVAQSVDELSKSVLLANKHLIV